MSNRRSRIRGIRRVIAAAAALGIGFMWGGPAFADQLPIDLADGVDARFDGAWIEDQSGSALGAAGDVNGDGYPDMIIGAPGADWYSRANCGAAYVVFGSATPGNLDLGTPGKAAITILGGASYGHAGWSVAGAGDFNNDKYADVIVGAPFDGRATDLDEGVTYVVFGSDEPTDVDLASLGDQGIRIEGASINDHSGIAVASAGDVNADGYADIIIGAEFSDGLSREDSGSAFVVFGSEAPTDVDLAALSSKGFRIDGTAASDRTGASVTGAGDVNQDGYADVLIGAPRADGKSSDQGAAYVVFGSDKPDDIDLASLGAQGIHIEAVAAYDYTGASVTGAGDVNFDSYADIVIGAPGADGQSREDSGSVFVVFGSDKAGTIDLAVLGDHGFRIDGAAASEVAGISVTCPGDVNADGTPDLLIGASGADHNGRDGAGSSYAVYGKTDNTAIDLAAIGTHGFRIDGAAAHDLSGQAVAGPGDVNDDGTPDLLIGAPGADNNGRSGSGSTYLLLESPPVVTAPAAPTGLTGVPGNAQVQLSWTAPDDGGTPITGYRIDTRAAGGSWTSLTTGPDTTYTATGLTNGTAYEFRIAATNAVATGPDSTIAGPYVPRTVPGAPTGLTGVPGNAQVQLTWTAPADGGTPITGYRIDTRAAGGSWTSLTTGTDTTYTATGLTNGTAYEFRIAATNAAGTGPESATVGPLTPVAPVASLAVRARKAAKPVPRTGKTTLVRSITVGPGQRATVKAKITPKRAAKKIAVKKRPTKVTVRVKKAPKAKIKLTITAAAPGMTPVTWTRTWKVR